MTVKPKTIKSLEENIGDNLIDISLSDLFCESDFKGKGNKSTNKQMELHQTTKLLDSEGNHHQNEKSNKANYQMGKIFANHTADNDKRLISKVLDIYTHTYFIYIYI